MGNENNILDEEIEIIDDFGNNSDNKKVETLENEADFLLDNYIKDDGFNGVEPAIDMPILHPQTNAGEDRSKLNSMQEPDLLSAFNIEIGNDIPVLESTAIPVETNMNIPNPINLDISLKEEQINTPTPVVNPINMNNNIEVMDNNDKSMPTLNTTEMIDSNLSMPIEINNQEVLSITKEQNKDADNKRGAVFIIILFILLIVFIVALPQITKLVQQIGA